MPEKDSVFKRVAAGSIAILFFNYQGKSIYGRLK